MGRIGISLSGIERSLLNRLAEANAAATLSNLRIASGNMVGAPRDDPSAFFELSKLRSSLGKVTATAANVTAAGSMVSQTQTALAGVRTQLGLIRTELLQDETRSLTGAQRAEAQANIDAAIAQINALASTEIDGRRLLDGSAAFYVSGRNGDQIDDVTVYATGGGSLTVDGTVHTAATQAQLTYNGDSDQINGNATFTLTGDLGSVDYTVVDDTDLTTVRDLINADSHKTGVTVAISGSDLVFTSVEYGSDADITVDVSSGTFIVGVGSSTSDVGTDATATLNNVTYTGEGNLFTVTDGGAHFTVKLDPTFTGDLDAITIRGDALTFALSTDVNRTSTLAISGVQAGKLGGTSGRLSQLASGGSLADLDGDTSQAIRVVDEALAQLTLVEGSVDGYYNAAISSSSSLLADMQTDIEGAIDDINLVDDTEETARMAYALDLAANAMAGLTIFRQQRSSIVMLIWKIAGLT